jgi:alpha-glucosidase
MYRAFICFSIGIILSLPLLAKDYILYSPDKQIQVTVSITDKITWSIRHKGQVLLQPSELAMTFAHGLTLGKAPVVQQEKRGSKDNIITAAVPVKSRLMHDRCNELALFFKGSYVLRFRVYKEGAAYRFETNLKEEKVQVVSETASFHFPSDYQVFWPQEADTAFQSHFENVFKDTLVSSYTHKQHGNLPMLLSHPSETKLLISEADLYDYPNLFLFGTGGHQLTAGFPKVIQESRPRGDRGIRITKLADYIAETRGTRTYPWRVVGVADDDKKILEYDLIYKLSTPSVLTDENWIRPGKVAWDWWNANNIYGVNFKAGINTETYKYYIDFASAFGLEYIILDEGWSRTTTDVLQSKANVDIPELVRYGASKNVGVILWTLWGPLDKELDEILDQFAAWGVKGIKVDFMARADQHMVNYYERVAQAAAKRKLLVDFHGAYKPVGLNRKYPNVLSFEGVRGLENDKWETNITPKHDVTLLFTRMTAGPMDYTPGAMINTSKENFRPVFTEPMSMGTRAHQASMYVLYESPLQMLADNPSNYWKDTVYTRFIAAVPTTWDTTIALQAKAGEYAAVARKHGNQWYIGAMTNWNKRELNVSLSFLDGKKYSLTYLADGVNADRHASDYKIGKQTVARNDAITIGMECGGGWLAVLVPAED